MVHPEEHGPKEALYLGNEGVNNELDVRRLFVINLDEIVHRHHLRNSDIDPKHNRKQIFSYRCHNLFPKSAAKVQRIFDIAKENRKKMQKTISTG